VAHYGDEIDEDHIAEIEKLKQRRQHMEYGPKDDESDE
jgi:hypothetical protein